ncbi:MAG: hypothetical protein ACI90V_002409 [Bacillariaceae sp.]|jgi:hypothetical protein
MNLLWNTTLRKNMMRTYLCHRALSSISSTTALNIALITGSTRKVGPPNPIIGPRVASFITKKLEERGNKVTLIDPNEFTLLEQPEFSYRRSDVPKKLQDYKNILMEADAYVCVTPEYNHAPSPGLVNVLNHFGSSVFSFKPSAIVSYSAGQVGSNHFPFFFFVRIIFRYSTLAPYGMSDIFSSYCHFSFFICFILFLVLCYCILQM